MTELEASLYDSDIPKLLYENSCCSSCYKREIKKN